MVFLFILLIILILLLAFFTSKIDIKITNLMIDLHNAEHINNKYEVIIKLEILKKIPILKFVLTPEKLKKVKKSWKMDEKIKQLEKNVLKNKFDIKSLELLKEFSKNIKTKKLNLKIEIGTEDAFFTSILVGIFASILSTLFSISNVKEEDIFYKIEPIFINQNLLKFEISGIFQIKLIHIINTIYVLSINSSIKNCKNEKLTGNFSVQ